MTLGELMAVFDNGATVIQICKDDDWDTYDSFAPNSKLFKSFYDKRVKCAEAVDYDEIRVDLDWSK